MDHGDTANRYSIRAVNRVCDVLDLVRSTSTGVSLPQVAAATGMPKSSAFRYLAVLEERGFVERDPDSALYHRGLAFDAPDTIALERLKRLAESPLSRLRDEIGLTVNLGFLDRGQVLHALVFESPHQMRLAARVGERAHLHATALGKVLALGLSDEAVRTILASHGMPQYTERTIVDPDAFLAALSRVRDEGYALDDSENQVGGRCLAVPIPGAPVPAGVSVSALEAQLPLDDVPGIAAELARIARRLGNELSVAV